MLLFQRGRGCAAGSAHTVMQRNNAAAHGTGIFLPFILQKDGKPACENGAAVGQKTGVVARTIAFFQTVQAPAGERGAFKAIAQALFTAAVPDGTGTAVTRLAFVPAQASCTGTHAFANGTVLIAYQFMPHGANIFSGMASGICIQEFLLSVRGAVLRGLSQSTAFKSSSPRAHAGAVGMAQYQRLGLPSFHRPDHRPVDCMR